MTAIRMCDDAAATKQQTTTTTSMPPSRHHGQGNSSGRRRAVSSLGMALLLCGLLVTWWVLFLWPSPSRHHYYGRWEDWTCANRWHQDRSAAFNASCRSQLTERDDKCGVTLVESIPEGIYTNGTGTMRTFDAFQDLIINAKHKIQIASSYWSLRASDTNTDPTTEPSTREGEFIYQLLLRRARDDGIKIQIAQNQNDSYMPDLDTTELAALDNVEVKSLNFTRLVGAGILHTKMMLVDGEHFYVGSNNFDWRSLTQVKEMGVLTANCPKLGADMEKLFSIYWMVGGDEAFIPDSWPAELDTNITRKSPLELTSMDMSVYLSSSPRRLCTENRDTDFDSILKAINNAEKFVYVAVMDYFPVTIYQKDIGYFPWIDMALRDAAVERKVDVRLLLSNWTSTRPEMLNYLESLTVISQPKKHIAIRGRYFKVPVSESQAKIPFARVNHNKYIITDKEAIIMTSNWSADYFLYTGGIGFGFTPKVDTATNKTDPGAEGTRLHNQLRDVFVRDWTSPYASDDL